MKPIEIRMPAKLPTGPGAEERYHAARRRLLAAQQEKAEAADEFLAARVALHSEAEAATNRSGKRTQTGPKTQASRVPRSLGWGSPHAFP